MRLGKGGEEAAENSAPLVLLSLTLTLTHTLTCTDGETLAYTCCRHKRPSHS